MSKKETIFNLTVKLSKMFDKNYYCSINNFNNNKNINFLLSNKLKTLNFKWAKDLNMMFHEMDIKDQVKDDKNIFFTCNNYMVNIYFVDQEHYKTKKEYMDYNVGVLINTMLSIFKMKYNYTGSYFIYSKHDVYSELQVTKSFEKICNLLRLNYNTYKHGFEFEEEMFAWLISSPFMDTDKFLNNRKIKNKIFMQFKKFIKDHNVSKTPDFTESVLEDTLVNEFPDIQFKKFIKSNDRELSEKFI